MSFWGIEVKPGKPITLYFDRTRGRLRISQATLGIGSAQTRSLVQCNVGNKTPVFLCALLPDRTESCHLDLEFEEADDVVFSVLGPRSVHLTGYYLSKSLHTNVNSDTESYGEDIANTDTEASDRCSDEDEYEDSFIDDDDNPEVFPSSIASSDRDGGKRKGNRKRLKKKHQVMDSEDENNSQEREDEDSCPLSAFKNKIPANENLVIESEDDNNAQESKGEVSCLLSAIKNNIPVEATSSECRENSGKVTVDDTGQAENGGSGEDGREEKADAVDMKNMSNICKDQPVGDRDDHKLALEHDAGPGKTAMPSKSEDAKSLQDGISCQGNVYGDDKTEQHTEFDMTHQVLMGTEDVQKNASDMNIGDHSALLDLPAEGLAENCPKLKKRKKECDGERLNECKGSCPGDVEGVEQDVEATDMDKDLLEQTEEKKVPTSTLNIGDHSDSLDLPAEERAEMGPKLKKRKKRSEGKRLSECKDSSPGGAVDEVKKDVDATDMDKLLQATTEENKSSTQNIGDRSHSLDLPAEERAENGPKLKKIQKESKGERLNECKDSSLGDAVEEVKQDVEATDMDKDLLATTEENKLPTSTQNVGDRSHCLNLRAEERAENDPKLKKIQKGSKGERLNECKDFSLGDAVEEVQQDVEATDMDKDLHATTEENKLSTSAQNIGDPSHSLDLRAEERAENGPKLKKIQKGSKGERLNECKDSSLGDAVEEVKQDVEATDMDKDLHATTEENKLPTSAQIIDVNSDVADGCQSVKKHKKKKKKKTKVEDEGTNSMFEPGLSANEIFVKFQDKGLNAETSQVRTLSNGLTIEELAKGEEDGKVATTGRKVKVYYTGMLRENGHTFCSNFGKTPYQFRLGNKQVIDGWNIGLEGMRVGDKRRLTIPPTMGYGSQGLGEDIPPNSWLVYDVQLVGVRR